MAGCAVTVLLAVTACAPSTGTAGSQPAGDSQPAADAQPAGESAATGSEQPAPAAAGTDLICTRATKVKIIERTSGAGRSYAFSPSRLTVQRGGFLAVTNTSDHVHALESSPDAGIVSSVLDLKERQVIQFPQEGTFTVRSASAAHRATLRVTVSGDTGCGTPEPTVSIIDGYAFSPRKLTVAATENFAVVNESGAPQSVSCTPGGDGDHSRLEPGETQLLALDAPGRYVCASHQHPSARVTVTVSD